MESVLGAAEVRQAHPRAAKKPGHHVPLEPSPLRVEVVAKCDDDEDVAQDAQSTSEPTENAG